MNDLTGRAGNGMNRDNGYRNEVCPACLSVDIHGYHRIDEYWILKCSGCGHVFVEDIPSDFELYECYEGAYQDSGEFQPKLRWHRKLKYWAMSRYLKSLFQRKERIRLLEIGCSQGDLLTAVADDKKFEARGIDYAGGPVEYARSQGLMVDQGSLEDMNIPDEEFNLVVAIHTVEHMQNPERSLIEVKRILENGGLFFAVVPCISHIKAKRTGFNWKYWGPPGHLWYFTTRSFRALLERLGFDVKYSTCLNNQAHMRILARKP